MNAMWIFGIMAAVMVFAFVFKDKSIMKKKPRKVKKRPEPFYMGYVKDFKKMGKNIFKRKKRRR